MSKHLKTQIMDRLANTCVNFVALPKDSTPCSKGVQYFVPKKGIDWIKGAMDTIKEGQKYKKRIVVRPSRHRKGLHELYVYHFPTHWSAGSEANRALMAVARREAHAIERDHTRAGLEWRIRFIAHHYNPEPGIKPYKRIFHFAYAVLQNELRSASCQASAINIQTSAINIQTSEVSCHPTAEVSLHPTAEEVTFEPIEPIILHRHRHFERVRYPYRL